MCVRYYRDEAQLKFWSDEHGVWMPPEIQTAAVTESFPGDRAPIVRLGATLELGMTEAVWGLVPPWAKEANFGRKNAYNARTETVREKATFRSAFRARRCLLPASGFYERANGRWLKIFPEDRSTIVLAGLFELENRLSSLPTFTMLTTVPNEVIEPLHDRMPVVLAPSDYRAWLSLETSVDELMSLLVPCRNDLLVVTDAGPVGKIDRGQNALF